MDYKITGKEKIERIKKVHNFVKRFGDGRKGLSKAQKDKRIEKIIGHGEIEKVQGFGKNKKEGVILKKINTKEWEEGHEGVCDPVPEEVIKNLDSYPNDIRSPEKCRITNIDVKDDGELIIEGIEKDGKEKDSRIRTYYSVLFMSDEHASVSEKKQFSMKSLKEVSDRTMIMHDNLDMLMEDPEINTGEDSITQY